MHIYIQTVYIRILLYYVNLFLVDEWPIERRLLECTRLCQRSTTAARKGCTMPLLLNIPFEFVVVDTLHLFLRIMGLLFHQVSLQVSYKQMPFSYANPFEVLALSGDKKGDNDRNFKVQSTLSKTPTVHLREVSGL